LPFLRLEATTPTEVEKTIEQQAEQINLLRAELDNERKERQGKKTEIEVMKEQIQTLQKTMSELEGIFRESLRVSREIKKKTGAKEYGPVTARAYQGSESLFQRNSSRYTGKTRIRRNKKNISTENCHGNPQLTEPGGCSGENGLNT